MIQVENTRSTAGFEFNEQCLWVNTELSYLEFSLAKKIHEKFKPGYGYLSKPHFL